MSNRAIVVLIGTVLVICIGIASASYVIGKKAHSDDVDVATSTVNETAASSKDVDVAIVTGGNSGGYTVKVISDSASASAVAPEHPQIDRPLAFDADVTADQRATLQNAADKLQKMISDDPTSAGLWVNLGTVRKMAGEFEGARQAWEYVSAAAPGNAGVISNLADLYANFLKDQVKAETYYLKVVKLAPQNTDAYKNLAVLYSVGNTTVRNAKAEDILLKGIDANPKAYDLRIILARLYHQEGDTGDAKLQYSYAAKAATDQGLTDIAASIGKEAVGL